MSTARCCDRRADGVSHRLWSPSGAQILASSCWRPRRVFRDVAVHGARLGFRITSEARDGRLVSCRGDTNRAGVWLEGTDALVEGSTFAHNRSCGVCVRPSSLRARLLRNDLVENERPLEDLGVATVVAER